MPGKHCGLVGLSPARGNMRGTIGAMRSPWLAAHGAPHNPLGSSRTSSRDRDGGAAPHPRGVGHSAGI